MKCINNACMCYRESSINNCDSDKPVTECGRYKPVEEVCIWEEMAYKQFKTCKGYHVVDDTQVFDWYKYCPYCGKKIKIKE